MDNEGEMKMDRFDLHKVEMGGGIEVGDFFKMK